jgi:hypothetical protein
MIKTLTTYFKSVAKPNLGLLVVLLSCLISNVAYADHYYGGYFYYNTIDDKTVQVSLVTFTDFHNDKSDRDSVEFEWGDGTTSFLTRVNNNELGEELYEGMKKNKYVGIHKYNSYDNYQLHFSDNNRLFDVKNIAVGISGVTNLRFDGLIPVQDSVIYCINDSPIPTVDPYFYGKSSQEFQLNYGYYDLQGDSMTFELVVCKGANGEPAEGYFIPEGASINGHTGQFVWENPKQGKYCFAFEVAEYRNGQLLGKSSTDFTLFISHSDFFNFEKGLFSNVYGTTEGLSRFSGAGVKQFVVDYSNASADSMQLKVISPFENNSAFDLTRKSVINTTSFVDTVNLEYKGDYAYNGYNLLLWEVTIFFGQDSVLKEIRSIGVAVNEFIDWPCEVTDLSEIHELAPNIPSLTISPNLFDDHVWINVGSAYENMTMNIFDMRGRMVRSYYDLSGSTVKLELGGLSSAMYIVQVLEDGNEIHVGKMIKR